MAKRLNRNATWKEHQKAHLNDVGVKVGQGNKIAEKPFDWELLDKLLARKMNQSDCADLLRVSVDTISNRIRERHNMTFSEYQFTKLAATKLSLIDKALELAIKKENIVMLKFCLKNICNWSELPVGFELSADSEIKNRITLNYNLAQNSITASSKVINNEMEKD